MDISELLVKSAPTEDPSIQVVRLKTSYWKSKRGLVMQKTLSTLTRKSKGFQLLDEEASAVGADLAMMKITNFDECQDGLYIVSTCNESRDWETGTVDDYDIILIPYQPLEQP